MASIKEFYLTFKRISKKAYLRLSGTMFLITLIGLLTVGNYGISWDEESQIIDVEDNFNLITTGKPIPGDSKYYGAIFNVSAEAIFQVQNIFTKGIKDGWLDVELTKESFYKRIQVKHLLTFLLSLVTYLSVAGMVGILAGSESAWFGAFILALFPRFWGHSFFNPKDIPFAAMFTLGTFLGTCLVGYYLKVDQDKDIKLGNNSLTIYSLLYGILVGLVTGTRIGGFFLLFFVGVTHLVISLGERRSIYRYFFRFWSLYGLMFVAWAITVTIIHPASWYNPIGWFWETLQYLSKHSWDSTILFEGKSISAKSIPWYYLPKWLFLTIPFIWQISFFIGLVLIFARYKTLTNIQRACLILVLLMVFFMPMIAILKKSTIYDGMRQFLFILPGIAVVSATALIWIYQYLSRKNIRIFAVSLLIILLSAIVFDMVILHPYEYIYFNRISGGLAKAENQYDIDYWGLSMREGMEWINDNGVKDAKVLSSDPLSSSVTFAEPHTQVVSYEEFKQLKENNNLKHLYYITLTRLDYKGNFPHCPIVHSVERQDVPLTVVKKCDY